MRDIQIHLPGVMTLFFDEKGNTYVQFVADDPDSVELESLLLNGSAQLLRNGQFEFVSKKSTTLKKQLL